MHKQQTSIFALAAGVVFLFITPAFADTPDGGKPFYPDADLVIKKDDIPKFEIDALNGSGEAARKLSAYYGAVRLDFEKELYWARVAAEDGDDPAYFYAYAVILANLDANDIEKRRMNFWLKKAADKGYVAAQKALEKESN